MLDNIYGKPYINVMVINSETEYLFAALAHPLRLRALVLMRNVGELCVCELVYALSVSQPMISRHLAQMREWGMVSDRRQGQWVYYRLADTLPPWAKQVLSATAEGVLALEPYLSDRAALKGMPNRPGAGCC